MKIKTWLLLTYLLVMLLPVGAVYGLYLSINAYYQDKHVAEYVEQWTELSALKKIVSEPTLFEKGANYKNLSPIVNEQQSITLYTDTGLILYSSNPLVTTSTSFQTKKLMLKDLYELKQNYQKYVYKEPVYVGSQLVGVYEITFLRTDWMENVKNRTYFVAIAISVMLAVFYALIVYLLNRRLNNPAKQLMAQMRAFAKGETLDSQLHDKSDEIGELAKSFCSMRQEIEETRQQLNAEQQQKEFMIASLSHDLKTPLTSIQAYTESLRQGDLSEQEQREYLQVISNKSDYMKQLLDDLTMYTLLQSPSYALDLTTVDGEEFFEMLLSDYETVCKEKGFQVEVSQNVTGDFSVHPKQLMRVMDNLVSNAWSYTEAGGFIGIAAFQNSYPSWCEPFVKEALTKQDGLYIIVQNSGEGIDKEHASRLFDPLYQVDCARSKAGQRGSGLGLSIAKRIIEKHEGTISVVSQKNSGTIVICWLPQH
ncbi:sensor histidine kinase [Solibacillus sp. FSL H8-0538]|uniref:sensor histidine kinase n=1 Tax=Solibacillus sp. FSL H8-0538 TaxID=2921400 RepID=UPI0030F64CB4